MGELDGGISFTLMGIRLLLHGELRGYYYVL